jgi:UDP:flavonoid glycosyltransferase YjiC (YdhE family)
MRALSHGTPLYDAKTLTGYVEEDLALLDQVRPDAIVGDFRLSLAVSAPLRRIPYLALANAYWSPYTAMTRWPIPDLLPVRLFGAGAAGALFNRIRPLVFWQHARPLNAVRRRFGLAPVGDMLSAYTWGDETLYLDVPELIPTRPLPANHHFIGPVIWEPPTALPDWWDALPRDRPNLYVTLGSSGPAALLPGLLQELAKLPVNVLAATAGRLDRTALPLGVWAADYLPGSRAAARAALVISNGGSPTGYQALSQGVPVLGIASNLDQHLVMHYLAAAGAGRLLRSERVNPRGLRGAVEQMLADDGYRVAARRVQGWFGGYRAVERLDERLAAWL